MKKLTLIILLMTTSIISFSQKNYEDVVYLKNGSVFHGMIVELVPNQSLKIETIGGNIFAFKMDEIEKYTKEPIGKQNTRVANANSGSGLSKGYIGMVDIGYDFGVGYFGVGRVQLDIINGYQFNPYFSIGIGTGLRIYPEIEEVLIPLYADFRVNFLDRKISPYFSTGLGYAFSVTNGYGSGGFLFNPALGARFKVSEKSSMFVALGYELQVMNINYYDTYLNYNGLTIIDDYYYYSSVVGAISLTVGVTF
jgi:hypothetical protein